MYLSNPVGPYIHKCVLFLWDPYNYQVTPVDMFVYFFSSSAAASSTSPTVVECNSKKINKRIS